MEPIKIGAFAPFIKLGTDNVVLFAIPLISRVYSLLGSPGRQAREARDCSESPRNLATAFAGGSNNKMV
jgi:hypothetical protein